MRSLVTMDMGRLIAEHARLLAGVVRVELLKRYAGSAFGWAWIALYPILFLSVYMFLFLIIFDVRFPGFSSFDYVVYVFAGLVPYLALSEVASTSAVSIKTNIHLIKNVVMPIDLLPIRVVGVALVTQCVGLAVLIAMAAINGTLSAGVLLLPLVILIQAMFLIGVAWFLAPLGVIFPDVGHTIGIIMLFLLFVSPIAFRLDLVPPHLIAIVTLNPVHYMLEMFRAALLTNHPVNPLNLIVMLVMSLGTFELGGRFFRRFKSVVVDYE